MQREEAVEKLRKLLRHELVVEVDELYRALGTRSRMTVFRRLREVGYRTSFTHGGRYYTEVDGPQFDDAGLWFHRDVGFSRAGTLKETVVVEVDASSDGRTHGELQGLLRVRVHNTLLELVREARIRREPVGGAWLYVGADPKRAAGQVERRRELVLVREEAFRAPSAEETIEVLVEALQAAADVPPPEVVAQRLGSRGVRLSARQVQQVYEANGLWPLRTPPRPSRPSRR